MNANKMMPTHGKRPEGLKADDIVWVQYRCGYLRALRCGDMRWDWDGDGYDIVAYCKAIMPEHYIPAQDYSKWIGKPCWFGHAENKEEVCSVLERYVVGERNPFRTHLNAWPWCRPVTADEIVKE